MERAQEVAIVGGAGRVGAPLGILLANRGIRTLLYDVNEAALQTLSGGKLPFFEEGGEALLQKGIAAGTLAFTSDAARLRDVPTILVAIGTPVDEFQNPVVRVITDCIDALVPHLSDGQLLVLRSTVFPGVTEHLHRHLLARQKRLLVACCPERTTQGHAIREDLTLPQIVSGATPEAEAAAVRLFSRLSPKIIIMAPREAELAKLFCNAYRYLQFAAANQLYMLAEAAGLDASRILSGIKDDYPRMRDLPSPGFAAGPCLYKDTLQLAAFANQQLTLGAAAVQINEGLPAFIVERLAAGRDLREHTVGLLGMSFKAESDDIRGSLSYKLKKLLQFRTRAVLTTDPFVTDDKTLLPLQEVIERSDVMVLCVPHRAYRDADFRGKPVLDVWG
jgi:UDP-N-acetyl-D-mannosaminuronic acid dehydrogenase